MPFRFHLLDVFAESRYSGNPLAVVVGDELPSVQTMQQVAAEINYSETAFVCSKQEHDGGYAVRMFTPAREIGFAGHPILGTAWVLRHCYGPSRSNPVHLNLLEWSVPVTFESAGGCETPWFHAPAAVAGRVCPRAQIAASLGVSLGDIEADIPIQQFSSGGTAVILVPLRGLDSLGRSSLRHEHLVSLAAAGYPSLVYLFCMQAHRTENDLCARFFFEAHGVREDPASGNAAAFLGAYLLEHRAFQVADLDLRVEQGYEIGRPSLVRVRARIDAESFVVHVGGNVLPVASGELV